jgi:hypothetical protein
MGDGGSGGDPQNYSQNPNSLLGKMLRLDVSGNNAGYAIPTDNPFTAADDPTNSIRDEIWAIGVRNPWRWSFDRITGDMWIADVGQNAYEEVNVQPASSTGGENYGWRCYEANNTYNTSGCLAQSNYTFPVYNYGHTGGACSVTGGYVYRGNVYNSVFGRYFYTDYCDGIIRGIIPNGTGGFTNESHGTFVQYQYTAFGEDAYGEVYIAQQNGVISRLTIAASLPRAELNASGPLTVCSGDPLTLSTGFNPLLSYEWTKNGVSVLAAANATFTPTESGAYAVKVSNSAGTTTSSELNVTVNPLPVASIEGLNDAYCVYSPEATLTLQPEGGILSGLGTNSAAGTFSPEQAQIGIVDVSYAYTDGNGCTGTSIYSVLIDSCVGIEAKQKQELSISPNPFNELLSISNAEKLKGEVKIVNAIGQTVLATQLSGSSQNISTQALPKGTYFVVIQSNSEQIVRKLIKN